MKSSPLNEKLGVSAKDDYTLVIELEQAVPYFVKMMGHTTVKPVNRKVVEKFGDNWTKPENFVGNGAYTLDNWVVNERIVRLVKTTGITTTRLSTRLRSCQSKTKLPK